MLYFDMDFKAEGELFGQTSDERFELRPILIYVSLLPARKFGFTRAWRKEIATHSEWHVGRTPKDYGLAAADLR